MTREEAIEKVRQMSLPKETMEILEALAPELRESEDERIRKYIINFVKLEKGVNLPPDVADRMLAYLEKQKEHQNNSDAPNESSWSGIISSSDKDKNLDEIAQDYVDGVKEYNPEPTWDLMQTAVCYGYHLAEQKEQKPAEWSEEEKDKLDSIERLIVNADAHGNYLIGDKEAIDLQHFIRSIVKPTTNLAEWSKGDEKMIERLITRLNWITYNTRTDGTSPNITFFDEIDWLKSLRPSWKPSEEQEEPEYYQHPV